MKQGHQEACASPTASQIIPTKAETIAAISCRWRTHGEGTAAGSSTARRDAEGGRSGDGTGEDGGGAGDPLIAERTLNLSIPPSDSGVTR